MTTYLTASEAARLLDVSKPTLYAYVSRGLIARRAAADGRSSLYSRDELERLLSSRSRRRTDLQRPTIDVAISSAITRIDDAAISYRGRDVVDLARTATFEQVCELLWSGALPEPPRWPSSRVAEAVRTTVAGVADPIAKMMLCALALAEQAPTADASTAARTMLTTVPSVLGGTARGSIAERVVRAGGARPSRALIDAVSTALVLLADHELATSTLAVRLACSVRASPYHAFAAGLAVVSGELHGSAATHVAALLHDGSRTGAIAAIERRRATGSPLAGFGHPIYRTGDPRFGPLMRAVDRIPDPNQRRRVVEAALAEAGRTVGRLPNVDFALGALYFVAGLPPDLPLFAIARLAGWGAHYTEELGERPLRFRGLTTPRAS